MNKKPASSDINNLFRKFGGDASGYQEIKQGHSGDKAQQSWPIVNAMQADRGSVSGTQPLFTGLKSQQDGAVAGLVGAPRALVAHASPSVRADSGKPTLRKSAAPAVAPVAAHAAPGMLFSASPEARGDSVEALFARLRNDPQPERPIEPTMPGLRGLFGALVKAK